MQHPSYLTSFNVQNCSNHWLALCLKDMIPQYQTLVKLDGMLLPIGKLFHYSSIKQTISEQAQAITEVQSIKIIKASTTRWLTHGEATSCIISRFETILDPLDTIVYEKGDGETKGVRDQLSEPSITFLLLLAEGLEPINIFSKYL